jgi:hypothetical protein
MEFLDFCFFLLLQFLTRFQTKPFSEDYFMIVKNLLVVGVVAGFATAAAAAEGSKANFKVGAKVRMDNEQWTMEDSPNGGTKTTSKSSSIGLHTAAFSLTGESGSDSLHILYHANTNTLRHATISHKLNDMASATFGQMHLLSGSWENSYDTADQYLYSSTHDMMYKDRSGAQVDLSFGDHKVAIQAVQGETEVGGKMFEENGGLSTSLQYRGNLGMVRPLISYSQIRTSASRSTDSSLNYGDGYATIMGAGVQADAAGATVDLELDTIKMHKQKNVTGSKDSNMQSIVAQVRYPVGANTTPFLKFVSESHKFGAAKDAGDEAGTSFAFGAEHKLDDACRLHAVYISKNMTTKNTDGKDDKDTHMGFNLGVTAAM